MPDGMQPGMQPGVGGMPQNGGMPGGQVPSPQEVVGAITQRLQELEAEKAQLVQALQEIQGQGMPQMAGPPQGPPQGMPQGPPQGMQGGLLA
jgi:hypothetical protein